MNNNLTLTCKESTDFKPHPEGIHPAVCVDVMDLGLVETEYQGVKKMVNKVKLTFESEAKTDDGKPCAVSKTFSASLHSKSNLAAFLGKWRGRPVQPGECISLEKLIGASCTLVISHQLSLAGKTYAAIDAVSKPTKRVAPSGLYDAAVARERYADWKAKQAGGQKSVVSGQKAASTSPQPSPQRGEGVDKSGAQGTARPTTAPDFDPEVGF